ncbi:MAG: protein-L-isoaspartate O-methyltransferase [Candidatus Doudnabacteria bacterium]|nr:protein-L-isoaspartate O-methyltransferase [Candidatus Doudnabacteria bacterium]
MNQRDLYNYLDQSVGFGSKEIAQVFKVVDRADFVPISFREEAYFDYPLPIAEEQTISQPSTVLFMLNLLDPKKGEKILDVGSGSGWTTALLAQIVGSRGEVQGVEVVPELVEFGRKNLAKYKFKQAAISAAGQTVGLPRSAPFDKILVSATAAELPQQLIDQLKVGGVMVTPIGYSVWKIKKISEKETEMEEFPGFAFVPLK